MNPFSDSPSASRERAGLLSLIVLAHIGALWAITSGAPKSSSQQATKVVSAFMVQAAPAAPAVVETPPPPTPQPPPPKPEPKPEPKPKPKPKPKLKPKPRIEPKPKPAITPPPEEPTPPPPPPEPVVAAAPSTAPVTAPVASMPTEVPARGEAPVTAAPPPAQPKTITSGVAYLRPPAPKYPLLSRRMGEEGKVVLRVLINERGRADRIDVHQSSGSARLDQAAREAVELSRFKPYIENGRAIAVFAIIPIAFNLEN
jgi:protein TonB